MTQPRHPDYSRLIVRPALACSRSQSSRSKTNRRFLTVRTLFIAFFAVLKFTLFLKSQRGFFSRFLLGFVGLALFRHVVFPSHVLTIHGPRIPDRYGFHYGSEKQLRQIRMYRCSWFKPCPRSCGAVASATTSAFVLHNALCVPAARCTSRSLPAICEARGWGTSNGLAHDPLPLQGTASSVGPRTPRQRLKRIAHGKTSAYSTPARPQSPFSIPRR
jgi:hypothetical protein